MKKVSRRSTLAIAAAPAMASVERRLTFFMVSS